MKILRNLAIIIAIHIPIVAGLLAQNKPVSAGSAQNTPAVAKAPEMTAVTTPSTAPGKLTLKPEPILEKDVSWQGRELNMMVYSPDFPKESTFASLQSKTGRTYEPASDSAGAMKFLRENHGKIIDGRLTALQKELGRADLVQIPVIAKSSAKTAATAQPAGAVASANSGQAKPSGQ